jgi:hypothetical protein
VSRSEVERGDCQPTGAGASRDTAEISSFCYDPPVFETFDDSLFSREDSTIARQERIGDWRRAQTLYRQLKSLRRNAAQWLVAEPGPQECRGLTHELLRLGEKYGVGRDVARATTLQEFFVGILQAIDNLDPINPAP